MALWGSQVRILSAPPASRNPCASIGCLLRFKEIIRRITRKGGNFFTEAAGDPSPAFASRLRTVADFRARKARIDVGSSRRFASALTIASHSGYLNHPEGSSSKGRLSSCCTSETRIRVFDHEARRERRGAADPRRPVSGPAGVGQIHPRSTREAFGFRVPRYSFAHSKWWQAWSESGRRPWLFRCSAPDTFPSVETNRKSES